MKKFREVYKKRKSRFKIWLKNRRSIDWAEYKNLCKKAKRIIVKTKLKKLYNKSLVIVFLLKMISFTIYIQSIKV